MQLLKSLFFWIFDSVREKCRSLIKIFLRFTTGLCELQRICYSKNGYKRCLAFERSCSLSKNFKIQSSIYNLDEFAIDLDVSDQYFNTCLKTTIETIIEEKNVDIKIHFYFPEAMKIVFNQIYGYKRLLMQLESLRRIAYNSMDENHERKLRQLWNSLMNESDVPFKRISSNWQIVGFQGDDPKTDFRGMGILSLDNLLYFAKYHHDYCLQVFQHSRHPRFGYFFAIVAINLTKMAYDYFIDKKVQFYLFNMYSRKAKLKDFFEFFCYLFYEFDGFWMSSEPESIMDYPRIHDSFRNYFDRKLFVDQQVFVLKDFVK